jgi:cyclohexanone monooxygenase
VISTSKPDPIDIDVEALNRSGMQVIGPGGQTLSKHWEEGPRTLYGFMTHGFPNFFTMSIAQAGAVVNYVHMADEQTKAIVQVIAECMRKGVATVQPTEQAENDWVETIVSGAKGRSAFLEACTPGYYNYEGKRERAAALNDFYAAGPMDYVQLLDEWPANPEPPGLEKRFTRSDP